MFGERFVRSRAKGRIESQINCTNLRVPGISFRRNRDLSEKHFFLAETVQWSLDDERRQIRLGLICILLFQSRRLCKRSLRVRRCGFRPSFDKTCRDPRGENKFVFWSKVVLEHQSPEYEKNCFCKGSSAGRHNPAQNGSLKMFPKTVREVQSENASLETVTSRKVGKSCVAAVRGADNTCEIKALAWWRSSSAKGGISHWRQVK